MRVRRLCRSCTRKLGNRERHSAENAAGIIVGGRNALLIGNNVLGSRDYKLTCANNSHDGENTDGYCQKSSVVIVVVTEIAVHSVDDYFGNVVSTATAAVAAIVDALKHVYAENYGLCYLDNGCGQVVFLAARLNACAEIRDVSTAAEGAYIAIAAVKNDLLIKHGDALELLSATVSDASLKDELDVETNIDGVKASVKLNGIEADVSFCNAGAFNSDCGSMLDYFFSEICEKYSCVFKAITVSARVKYSVSLYTNSFRAFTGAA